MIEFFLQILFTILIIADPFGNTPLFLFLTEDLSLKERKQVISKAAVAATTILILFALAGNYLLKFFSIDLGALRIAGGILLFIVAIEMILTHGKEKRYPKEEQKSLAITPMATPLIAGPGTMAASLVFINQGTDFIAKILVLLAILLAMFISWLILVNCHLLVRFLKQDGARALTKIMGLLLATIAVGMICQGLKAVFPILG